MPAEQAVHTSESAEPLRAEPATQTHVAAAVPLLESAGQAVQLVEPARLYVFAKHARFKNKPSIEPIARNRVAEFSLHIGHCHARN